MSNIRPCCHDCLTEEVTVRVVDDMGFEHWFCDDDWTAQEAFRERIAELFRKAMDTMNTQSLACSQYSVPAPGKPQCEADGVRNGPDGPGGTEHYWSCTAPGTVDVDGILMCDDHAGERGHGPKQAQYGYDPRP